MPTNKASNALPPGVAGLISINKPYTDEIFITQKKQIEWRKHPLPLGKYYVYETKRKDGCGKIIGEFKVCEHRRYSLKSKLELKFIPPIVVKLGCVGASDLYKYANGKPIYANLITNVINYERPKELNEFIPACEANGNCEKCRFSVWLERFEDYGCSKKRLSVPPQSWCRGKEEGYVKTF